MKYTLKPCKHSSTKYGILKFVVDVQIRGSIVVSISACHADDPGSIPGCGVFRLHNKETIWMQRHVRESSVGGFGSGLLL